MHCDEEPVDSISINENMISDHINIKSQGGENTCQMVLGYVAHTNEQSSPQFPIF